MNLAQVLDERKSKTSQAVLVSNDQSPNIASDHPINHGKKTLAIEVETAANLFNPLVNSKATSRAKLFQCVALVGKVWFLPRARYPTVSNTPLLSLWLFQPQGESQVIVQVVAAISHRTAGLESFLAVPSLQCMNRNTYSFRKLTNRIHVYILAHV